MLVIVFANATGSGDMLKEKHMHRTNISTISPPHHQPAQILGIKGKQ
jgi:hypothetical protein